MIKQYFVDLYRGVIGGWNRFWFTPADPATLSLIRVLAGLMLLYTHAVWTLGLEEFFGPHSWVGREAATLANGPDPWLEGPSRWSWSYLWWCESPSVLWTVHIAALVVFAMLALGLFTRVAAVLAYLITVAYAHRTPGALFGLDQINGLLAMYLMVGPAGARYSVDRLIARLRAGDTLAPPAPSASANIAVRLIQLHMCVIYFFAGLAKLQGPTWWEGTALWGALANLEYQSLDMTWLANHLLIVNVMTHVTVFWELSFAALIWPRLSRPIVLAIALPLHLGIAFCMGMITFGLVMLIGCLAFVSPALVRAMVDPLFRWELPRSVHRADATPATTAGRARRGPMTPLASPPRRST